MKVVLFGATGMVGQGVLRECLLEPAVESVLTVGRSATRQHHQKLRGIVQKDLFDLSSLQRDLTGYDACFFCLGISSWGMSERDYQRVTYDLTLSIAQMLVKLNPAMTFVYVSGMGTDSSERGRMMWARVKGKTENALLKLPFKAAYMFRPAIIQPLRGIVAGANIYHVFYQAAALLFPVLKKFFPKYVTTTEQVGRAMIQVARYGAPKAVLDTEDINRIGQST